MDLAKFLKGLEIIVMSRERPQELQRALDALEVVDFGTTTYIRVSENPPTTVSSIKHIPEKYEHTLRKPGGNSIWHLNEILGELKYEWTLITHDDDEILPKLGEVFREHSSNSKVSLITGLSRILDMSGKEIRNARYEQRLTKAGLDDYSGKVRFDLAALLFDLGSLFPASAMIIRSAVLSKVYPIPKEIDLAQDLSISMSVTESNGVIFEGMTPIMNYHLHDSNSVYSDSALGGLKADLTVTRLNHLVRYPSMLNRVRRRKLTRDILISKILATSFSMKDKQANLRIFSEEARQACGREISYWPARVPLFIGPIKRVVRWLVRIRVRA